MSLRFERIRDSLESLKVTFLHCLPGALEEGFKGVIILLCIWRDGRSPWPCHSKKTRQSLSLEPCPKKEGKISHQGEKFPDTIHPSSPSNFHLKSCFPPSHSHFMKYFSVSFLLPVKRQERFVPYQLLISMTVGNGVICFFSWVQLWMSGFRLRVRVDIAGLFHTYSPSPDRNIFLC